MKARRPRSHAQHLEGISRLGIQTQFKCLFQLPCVRRKTAVQYSIVLHQCDSFKCQSRLVRIFRLETAGNNSSNGIDVKLNLRYQMGNKHNKVDKSSTTLPLPRSPRQATTSSQARRFFLDSVIEEEFSPIRSMR